MNTYIIKDIHQENHTIQADFAVNDKNIVSFYLDLKQPDHLPKYKQEVLVVCFTSPQYCVLQTLRRD